ncbi:cytochrome c oxidase assembly factor Coa1 family protein [Flavimarina sp. Hel_I_48]|uniref:cytochrome c oxidase assembly factor Coa1 family protein n=1 Tax=Flavimarina sp. Hel_I_48 TaxID=1392488 RepID=UPI0004DF33C3|nr:cytochrome c oxidase assembly factor Coa1 family protein [Flavimarina sp. Hel_I_48]
MNDNLIEQKSWWGSNWKWLVPVSGIILFVIAMFFSSGMDGITTDLVQAYADTELYENALEKVKSDKRVTELLGGIKPIDNLAILEGFLEYSNDNKTVNSSIRIVGDKGKASLDISADKLNGEWNYTKINVRIKKPPEKKQTIEIVTAE